MSKFGLRDGSSKLLKKARPSLIIVSLRDRFFKYFSLTYFLSCFGGLRNMQPRNQLLKLVLCLPLLSACSDDQGPTLLDDYLDRLANVLSVDREPAELNNLIQRLPQQGAAALSGKPDSTIGILDFLSLSGCELSVLVAQRNSSLGKLAKPSQHLLYELDFLRLAPVCIDKLQNDGNGSLAQELAEVVKRKQDRLPSNIWRAILLAEEASLFWRPPHHLGDYPVQDLSNLVTRLVWLKSDAEQWLAGNYAAGTERLEESLSYLNQGEGGMLWKSLSLYEFALREGNSMLQKQSGALCRGQTPLFNTVAAKNVVTKFFVGGVQSWASQLSTRYYQFMPHYRELELLFEEVEIPDYKKWRLDRDLSLEKGIAASKAHVRLLQPLLDACANMSLENRAKGEIKER